MPDIVSYVMPRHHIMKNIDCRGSELSLLSCEHAGFAKHYGCKESVVLHCESVHVNEEEVSPTKSFSFTTYVPFMHDSTAYSFFKDFHIFVI